MTDLDLTIAARLALELHRRGVDLVAEPLAPLDDPANATSLRLVERDGDTDAPGEAVRAVLGDLDLLARIRSAKPALLALIVAHGLRVGIGEATRNLHGTYLDAVSAFAEVVEGWKFMMSKKDEAACGVCGELTAWKTRGGVRMHPRCDAFGAGWPEAEIPEPVSLPDRGHLLIRFTDDSP